MRLQNFRRVALLSILVAMADPAAGDDVSLDWKIRNVSVTPQPTFEGPVTIGCQWRATVDHHFQWTKVIQWSGMFLVDDQSVLAFTVKYQPNNVIYMPPNDQDWEVGLTATTDYDFGGTATNEFNGTREHTVNLATGFHKVGCAIALTGYTGEASNRKGDNTREIPIEVRAMGKLDPGGKWPAYNPPVDIAGRNKAPQGSTGNVQLPRPTLSAIVKSAAINPTCADFAVASAEVEVHADLPLGAYQGKLSIVDAMGALTNAEQSLPAIGANESKLLKVSLAAKVPPPALVGAHPLVVSLVPKEVAGQPAFNPPAPIRVTIVFPSGFCPSAKVDPPPGRPARAQLDTLVLPKAKGEGSGLMVPTPTAHSVPGRPPNEKAEVTTPVIPKLEFPPPGAPRITPRIPLMSSSPSHSRAAVSTPAPTLHSFRPGEKLFLKDGRSLAKEGATLVLLDPSGRVVRSYASGTEVFVDSTGQVSVRSGAMSEPVGVLKPR